MGAEGSRYRQEYDKAKAALDQIADSLSSEQWKRAQALAATWPYANATNIELANGSNWKQRNQQAAQEVERVARGQPGLNSVNPTLARHYAVV
jgi:hypothetical protein